MATYTRKTPESSLEDRLAEALLKAEARADRAERMFDELAQSVMESEVQEMEQMSDKTTLEGKLEFVGYEDRTQASNNPFFKMGQMMAEKDARIREQRDLLDECEKAVEAIIEDQTTGGGDDTFPIAKTLLAKLRAAQKKAD